MTSKKSPSPVAAGVNDGNRNNSSSGSSNRRSLNDDYPVNSVMEITLSSNENEKVTGLVYCTDDISNTIVLSKSLNYTTLSSDIWVVNVSCVVDKKIIVKQAPVKNNADSNANGEEQEEVQLAIPLMHISKEEIEKKEKRAISIAEDSFKHLNQKASPEGQKVFELLLKACGVVVWKGESILVLNQIKVDPPYAVDNCRLIQGGDNSLHTDSLNRVKRIVGTSRQ